MAIDDNTLYGLTGAQIKELPGKIEAVKGLARELTADDYNWPTSAPDGVALWLLDNGLYHNAQDVKLYYSTDGSTTGAAYDTLVTKGNNSTKLYMYNPSSSIADITVRMVSSSGSLVGTRDILNDAYIVDNLASTRSDRVLSAAQGKALKDLIDAITGFSYEVVQTLPASGQNGKIYLVPIDESGGPADNVYEEYIWVNNAWEMIGTTEMDLTNYVQFSDLATVATSGDYNDLSNKPTVPTVVQTTGASTTDVMSQAASTALVYPNYLYYPDRIRIGSAATATSSYAVAIGDDARASAIYGIALGSAARANGDGSIAISGGTGNIFGIARGPRSIAIGYDASAGTGAVGEDVAGAIALGAGALAKNKGEMNIGSDNTNYGYNNSNYRLLTGLYDPQSAHDAANKEYVDNLAITYAALNGTGAPTTTTEGEYVGQLYYDTTNEAMYFLKAIDNTTTPATYTWEELGGGPTVVQTTGTSTTDVMSQNAVTNALSGKTTLYSKIQANVNTPISSLNIAGDGTDTYPYAPCYYEDSNSGRELWSYIRAYPIFGDITQAYVGKYGYDAGESAWNGKRETRLALYSDLPATFTTNEWNALWA